MNRPSLFVATVLCLGGCVADASSQQAGSLLEPEGAALVAASSHEIPAAELLPVLHPGWEAQAVSAAGLSSPLDDLAATAADVGGPLGERAAAAGRAWQED